MGYVTLYKGSVKGSNPSMNLFISDADKGVTFGEYRLPLSDWNAEWMAGGDRIKWYSFDDDCKALSLNYPNLLFSLTGNGEEGGDVWKAWYRNGKSVMVQGRVVFDKPDLDTELPLDLDCERRMAEEAVAKADAASRAAQQALEEAERHYQEVTNNPTT